MRRAAAVEVAAGNKAGAIQPGNGVPIRVEHLSFVAGLDAADDIIADEREPDGIERPLVQFEQLAAAGFDIARSALMVILRKRIRINQARVENILARLAVMVEGCDGITELFRVHAGRGGQLFQRFRFIIRSVFGNEAFVFLQQADALQFLRVIHGVELIETVHHGIVAEIAVVLLAGKPLALKADDHRHGRHDVAGIPVAVFGAERINDVRNARAAVDIIVLRHHRAGLACHNDSGTIVANARAGQIAHTPRNVLSKQLVIVRIAAGSKHNISGVDDVVAIRAFSLRADNRARFVLKERSGLRMKHQAAVLVFIGLLHRLDAPAAVSVDAALRRDVGRKLLGHAGDINTAARGDQRNAERLKHLIHVQRRVDVLFDALHVRRAFGNREIVVIIAGVYIVLNRLRALLRAGHHEAAGGEAAAAAHIVQLFNQQHVHALLRQPVRRHESRIARAHNKHVALERLRLALLMRDFPIEHGRIGRRFGKRILHGADHRAAGIGRAADGVDGKRLVFKNAHGDHIGHNHENIVRFVVIADLDIDDRIVRHRDGDVHGAVISLRSALIGARSEQRLLFRRRAESAQQHRHAEQHGHKFPVHGHSSFFSCRMFRRQKKG